MSKRPRNIPCFLVCDDWVGCILASLLKPSKLPLMASKASSRLFSPVWVQTIKQNKQRHHLWRNGCVLGGNQTFPCLCPCLADCWLETGLTLGLTLLSSRSLCFCSSNCRLFLSSSSIFCCCSRRFLQQQKGCWHHRKEQARGQGIHFKHLS